MEGQTVYVDSPAFIYFFENNEQYEIPLDRFFTAMDQGHFRTVASTIVLAEILVQPCRLEQWELAEKYELILAGIPHLSLLPVDRRVARTAAKLRVAFSLLTPVAIHLATAVSCRAEFFLTNDRDFRKIKTSEIQMPELILLDDL